MEYWLNPYSPNVTFLYPLKTLENLRFSDVFRGYRNVTLGEYGLKLANKIPIFFPIFIQFSEFRTISVSFGNLFYSNTFWWNQAICNFYSHLTPFSFPTWQQHQIFSVLTMESLFFSVKYFDRSSVQIAFWNSKVALVIVSYFSISFALTSISALHQLRFS